MGLNCSAERGDTGTALYVPARNVVTRTSAPQICASTATVDRDDAQQAVVLGGDPHLVVSQGVGLTHRFRGDRDLGAPVVDGLDGEAPPEGIQLKNLDGHE